MAIGYSDNIRSQVVQTCTPELLHQALKSNRVKTVCAQLADALESKLRGDICNDDYEEMKKKLKSQLPILTPHATFRNGRRKNDEAIPSGLSIYDIDHIPNPRGYWEEKKKVLANKMLGGTKASSEQASCVLDLIVLVHVTPSTQGLRLVFIIPEGMDIAMAQRWMSQQLEDSEYDTVVKDLARPSFLVPEEYLLYINEEELFKERKVTPQNSNHKVQSSNLKVQISKFKVTKMFKVISMFKVMKMFKIIDFRALTAITLFLLALLFSLPNLLIAILLMILISALLELIKLLAEWQIKKPSPLNTKAFPMQSSLPK